MIDTTPRPSGRGVFPGAFDPSTDCAPRGNRLAREARTRRRGATHRRFAIAIRIVSARRKW
ncbi:hypothetical protein CNO08_17930 [Lysobacter capsici]|nr:hypothetical protein CNO08_17930 [Lysobacter capsici]